MQCAAAGFHGRKMSWCAQYPPPAPRAERAADHRPWSSNSLPVLRTRGSLGVGCRTAPRLFYQPHPFVGSAINRWSVTNYSGTKRIQTRSTAHGGQEAAKAPLVMPTCAH